MNGKITPGISPRDSRALAVARIRAMIDFKLGPDAAAGARTFGDLRMLLNVYAPEEAQISDGQQGAVVRALLNGWHNEIQSVRRRRLITSEGAVFKPVDGAAVLVLGAQ